MLFLSSFSVGIVLAGLSASSFADKGKEKWYVERNRRTIESIYNLVTYPNNLPIVESLSAAVPDNLFNENVTGRVTPLGSFEGLNNSIEYFFVIAVPSPPNYSAFSKAEVVQFSSECPEVAASTVHLESSLFIPGQPPKAVSTLKQIAFWNFDENGAVLNYDALVPSLSRWTSSDGAIDLYAPEAQQGSIVGVCNTATERCVGPNKQYESFEQCVQFLTAKPFGHYDDIWGDNVICRSIHLLLTITRPDIHCPHVGPDGGGKCIDKSYADKYINDEGIFGAPSAEIFKCPSRT